MIQSILSLKEAVDGALKAMDRYDLVLRGNDPVKNLGEKTKVLCDKATF